MGGGALGTKYGGTGVEKTGIGERELRENEDEKGGPRLMSIPSPV
jgi:hypothetical protein